MNERSSKHGELDAYARFADEVPPNHASVPTVDAKARAASKAIWGEGGFVEAFGGDGCREPPKAWYWQITYVGNRRFRYLPRECLNHLDERRNVSRYPHPPAPNRSAIDQAQEER